MYILKIIIFILTFSTSLISYGNSEELIKIGVMLHLTGDVAMQGKAFKEGIEVAYDNADSKLQKRIKLIFEDTELLPNKVHRSAKKLIEFDKVDVAIISTFQEIKTAGPLFEKAKIPLICLWDSSPELEKMGEYLFAIGTWLPYTGEVTSNFAYKDLGKRRAAIISVLGDWSSLITNDFVKNFKKLGGEIVFQDTYNHGETDFRSLLLKIKKHRPDVIYAPIDSGINPFFKTLRVLNIKVPVIQSDNLNKEWINNLGGLLEGVYQSQTLTPKNNTTKIFKNLYKEKYKKESTELLYNSWGFDGLNLILKSIKEGAFTAEEIKNSLYKINNYDGTIGNISINRNGSHRMGVNILRVEDGDFKVIK